MPQLNKGDTFADGQQVTGARLNQLVDSATLLPGAITDQSAVTANDIQSADRVLVYDDSATALRKASVGDVLNASLPVKVASIAGPSAADLPVVPASGQKVDVQGALQVLGATTLDNTVSVTGKMTLSTTGAVKIPVGTTAQRPVSPVAGDMRFNSTISKAEVYNGTEWKEVGASPFDASGGNYVLEPSSTTTSALFSSDGSVVTVTDGLGHSIKEGQVVEIVSAVAGYLQFEGIAYDITTFTFKVRLYSTQAAQTSISCTYRKSGDHKVHVFTTSGSFVVGANDGYVDVFMVGGGGGSAESRGGGAGGFVEVMSLKIAKNQTLPVIVGSGAVAVQANSSGNNGGDTSFNGLIAYGGRGCTTTRGGYSGGNNIGSGQLVTITSSGAGELPRGTHSNDSMPRHGIQSYIANVRKLYSYGGFGSSFTMTSPNEVYPSAFSLYSTTSPYHANANTGCGGIGANLPNCSNGGSGIVIIRYPYKLQT